MVSQRKTKEAFRKINGKAQHLMLIMQVKTEENKVRFGLNEIWSSFIK